jgi:hypothetical protein
VVVSCEQCTEPLASQEGLCPMELDYEISFIKVQEHLCLQKHISLKPLFLSQFLMLLITLEDFSTYFCKAFINNKMWGQCCCV